MPTPEDVYHVLRLIRALAIPVNADLGIQPVQQALSDYCDELLKMNVTDDEGNPISARQRLMVAGLEVGLDMAKQAEKVIRDRSPNAQEQAELEECDLMPWDDVPLENLAEIALLGVPNPKHRALVFLEWALGENVDCLYSFFAANKKAFNKMKCDARKSSQEAFRALRNIAGRGGAHVPDGCLPGADSATANPNSTGADAPEAGLPCAASAVGNPNSTGAELPPAGLPRALFHAIYSPGTPLRYVEVLRGVRWLRTWGKRRR